MKSPKTMNPKFVPYRALGSTAQQQDKHRGGSSFASSHRAAKKNSRKITFRSRNCKVSAGLMLKRVPGNTRVGLFCADTLCLYLQKNNLKIIPVFGLCLQVSHLDRKSRIRSDEGKTGRATDLDMEKSYYGSQQQLQR